MLLNLTQEHRYLPRRGEWPEGIRNKIFYTFRICGPGSSIDIASDYGLDGPGSNSGGDEIFRPSRPAVGPT